MNNKIKVLLMFIFFFSCITFMSHVTVSAEVKPTIELLDLRGAKEILFSEDPIIRNGVTLVQFRPIFEALGLEVEWDAKNRKAIGTKDNFYLELTVGSNTALVNDSEKELSLSPTIVNGSVMVPLRFVGEATGRQVYWRTNTEGPKISIRASMASDIIEALYSDHLKYVGETKNNLPHGVGQYYYMDELFYEGDFIEGVMEGKGKFYFRNSQTFYAKIATYEGELKNNLPNGKGIMIDESTRYEGTLKNGLRQGKGKLYFADKLNYEGDFIEDQLEGKGTMYYSDGEKYVGEVHQGRRWGWGKQYDSDGDLYYEGEFYGNRVAASILDQYWSVTFNYIIQEKEEKARTYFNNVLEYEKDKRLAYSQLALFYLLTENTNRARENLELALDFRSKEYDALPYVLLAITDSLEENYSEADKTISLLDDRDPYVQWGKEIIERLKNGERLSAILD